MMVTAAVPQHDVRQAASGPRPAALWAVALAGLALGATTFALGIANSSVTGVQIALLEWISLPYIAAGLVAWWRRPDSRLGLLMIVGGFVSGLSALQFGEREALYTIGSIFDILPAALFLHVVLAYPDGRLRSRFERVLVVAAYTAAIGLQLLKLWLGAFPNSIEIWRQPNAAARLEEVQLLSLSALCLTGVGVLVARRLHAGRPRRRSLDLLIDSFALGLVMIAVLFVVGSFDVFASAFRPIQRATLVVVGLSPIVFLLGLLDARLARSGVGDLVIELRSDPTPAELRDALARALDDPSLTLAYWLPDDGRYVDLDGRPVDVPDRSGRTATPIERNDIRVAALLHDPALDDEPELLAAVGAAAGIALENGRLQAELAARLDEVKTSRARVIEAGHKERQRLERDLHDGAQQRLVGLALQLRLLEKQVGDQPGAKEQLDEARREIDLSLAELRDLARGIHPAVLTGRGLAPALESVAARAPVPVQLDVEIEGRVAEPVEVAAYYVVTESLANIAKHAQATNASIAVARTNEAVVVEIVDDGIGGADATGGSGLRGLADRVEALGGSLSVSTPHDGGTRVRADIPCD
jgi:signal transduction histidine kinase